MRTKASVLVALLAVFAVLVPTGAASAASNPTLSQIINGGSLTVDIVDSTNGNQSVGAPTVAFGATSFSFACETATATLGTPTQQIYVSNMVENGVKLDINSAVPGTSVWSDGGTNSYKYNDPAGTVAGCDAGQMSVDATASFTKNLGSVAPTVTQGSSAFDGTGPVTLLLTADDVAWTGSLEGIELSQKVPAEQSPGSYSLNMVISAIAN